MAVTATPGPVRPETAQVPAASRAGAAAVTGVLVLLVAALAVVDITQGTAAVGPAEVLKARGAKKVYAYCTHPIFSGPAIERISKGEALDEVVVTNTIPLNDGARACGKIRQLTVAPLIAETIQRIAKGDSVMSLFSEQDNLF